MQDDLVLDKVLAKLQPSEDLTEFRLQTENGVVRICYFSSLCDADTLQKKFFPFLKNGKENETEAPVRFKEIEGGEAAAKAMYKGWAIAQIGNRLVGMDAWKPVGNQPKQAQVEIALQGTNTALSDNMTVNLNLIRGSYPDTTLHIDKRKIGTNNMTDVAVLYDDERVDKMALEMLKNRLVKVTQEHVQAAGRLQNLLTPRKYNLFPTIMMTERPDRIVLNLRQGKVVVLIDGDVFALIAPAVFYDFMSSMDDKYQTFWVSLAIVLLRYIGVAITTTLAALYIALTSYNPGILRVQLTMTITGSRAAVPYPSFWEVLFMLLMMEMLIEASIRLPKAIGPTATTVGGLILGQAAQQANLVSSIIIIIVAAVAIANFVVPINSMGFAIRIVRYPLIIAATLFGTLGLMVGGMFLLLYLVDLRSFGKPYLYFRWPTFQA